MRVATRLQTSLDRLIAHDDRDVRLQAARCVGHLPGPAVVARLRELCGDPDPLVRREALHTLASRAALAGRTALRHAFNDETDLDCRRAALAGLVAIGDTAIRPALRRLIRNPDAFIYEPSPASQASRQALCCEAVQALAVLGDASVVGDLEGLLQRHVSARLDDAVIRTLAALGEAGHDAVVRLVRDAAPPRAERAIAALAGTIDRRRADALAIFLDHRDAGVRRVAAAALARTEPSHSALLRRAGDPDATVRATVAAHAGPTMPSILEILIDDPDTEVAAAALEALAHVPAGQRPGDLLWRVRGKLRSGNVDIARAAASTLAELDPAAARLDLGERLADTEAPEPLRVAAIRVLVKHGPEAAPLLAGQLFATAEEVRRTALDALVGLARTEDGGAEVRGILLRIAASDDLRADGTAPPRGRRRRGAEAANEALRRELAARLVELPTSDTAETLARLVAAAADAQLAVIAVRSLARVAVLLPDVPAAAVATAQALLQRPDAECRLAGLTILTQAADSSAENAAAALLEDGDARVRAQALRWFGRHPAAADTALVGRLEQCLRDREDDVRLAAVDALARIRGNGAAGRLVDAALLTAGGDIEAAAAGLGLLDPAIVEHELARRLATVSARDRQLALLRLSDAVLRARAA